MLLLAVLSLVPIAEGRLGFDRPAAARGPSSSHWAEAAWLVARWTAASSAAIAASIWCQYLAILLILAVAHTRMQLMACAMGLTSAVVMD